MKQKLLSLVVTFVAMFACVGSMQAQIWKGGELIVGHKYFVQNVAYKSFVSGETTTSLNPNEALVFTYGENGNAKFLYTTSPTDAVLNPWDAKIEANASTGYLDIELRSSTDSDYLYYIKHVLNAIVTKTYRYLGEDSNRNLNHNKDGKNKDPYTWRIIPAVEADLTINSSAEYGTFVAPFDVTLPEGVTAYTIASTTGTSAEDGVANFTAIEGNVLPACTPAVVYKAGGCPSTKFYGLPTTTAETVTGTNGLVGVLVEGQSAPENSYVINYINNHTAFYIVGSESTISVPKNRCYLTAQAAAAAKLNFSFGNATAITPAFSTNATVSAIYNAAGARVSATQKGMNIIKYSDGSVKKVLVK